MPGIEALSCRNDFTFHDHLHDGHVIWVNSGGGEHFRLKGRSDILQPGSISIIEPQVVHSNSPTPESDRHLRSLYIEERFFHHLDALYTGHGGHSLSLGSSVISHKQQWQQVIALHETIICGAEKIAVEEKAISLFYSLLGTTSTISVDLASTSNGRQTIGRVVDYMRAEMAENLSLEMLAVIAGCTSFHLMRLFKRYLGLSPHAYLVQLRLEHAKKMLDTGYAIADAAFLAGFSDQSHLTRLFKKRYGITPGIYLQQIS